jgi:hypothetical protein
MPSQAEADTAQLVQTEKPGRKERQACFPADIENLPSRRLI